MHPLHEHEINIHLLYQLLNCKCAKKSLYGKSWIEDSCLIYRYD